MATYKGNVGHLMQHWTLCELLAIAQKHDTSGLNYIDAHAMAPWATTPTDLDERFKKCRDALPGQGSAYERAWKNLADQRVAGYPSSAALVREVWKGDYSLLLCEIDPSTINAINNWLPGIRQQPNCTCAKLFEGDWRDRFKQGLPGPADVGLPGDSLTLVSFDPNVCSRSPDRRNPKIRPWNLYPIDLKFVLCELHGLESGVLIQLSTYTANGNNPQEAVIDSVDYTLTSGGFHLQAKVRPLTVEGQPHEGMMSLVYERNVAWAAELAGLPDRFEEWLRT